MVEGKNQKITAAYLLRVEHGEGFLGLRYIDPEVMGRQWVGDELFAILADKRLRLPLLEVLSDHGLDLELVPSDA